MADIYTPPPGSTPGEPPKKRNTTLIVILVIVALLLCCCCIVLYVAWTYGDQLLNMLQIDLNTLVPGLTTYL